MIALLSMLACTPAPLAPVFQFDNTRPTLRGELPALLADIPAPEPDDTGEPEPSFACSDRAFGGPVLQAREGGGYEDNGLFWDLVIQDSGLWEMDLILPMLGYDSSGGEAVDCAYAGRAAGQRLSEEGSALQWFKGDALVYSTLDDPRCAVGLQALEVHLAAPEDCAEIRGIYIHDFADPTGQGTLALGSSYDLEEVEDDPETELPALGPGGCPIDAEMVFRGDLTSVNSCSATMVLTIEMDKAGAVVGDMVLEDASADCDLLSATVSAQITEDTDGLAWINGTAEGIVTAEGTAEVTESCTVLRDGRFVIPAWGDEEVAFFDLQRDESG